MIQNTIFDDRLMEARRKKGLTVRQAAAMLRLPYTTYNNYEKGNREPTGGMICKLAEFYGVTTDYLLGRKPLEAESKAVTSTELDMKLAVLDEHGKRLVTMVLDAEYERCTGSAYVKKNGAEITADKPFITMRSSQYRVSAGTGFSLDEGDDFVEILVPDTPLTRKADFCLTITGNSMEPVYHDGDIVLVKRADLVRKGEIGIFVVDGSGYIKKYGGDRLISINSDYDDIILTKDSFAKCFGKVIGRL